MNIIKCDLSKEITSLEIIIFADLHIGDPLCDMKAIEKEINYVKEHETVYCVLNGDLINNATKTSVSDVYGEKLTPLQQIKKAVEMFKPIKEKIICVTTGNHEFRTYRNDGIDLTNLFCMELQIEDKYAGDACVLFLRFGNLGRSYHNLPSSYTFYITHGSGGGKREGSKINALADMANIIDTDIYIHSHTHLPAIMKQDYFRVDQRKSSVLQVPKLFVNTGASLNYGGYGEVAGFKPSSKQTPRILLSGSTKSFTATL